MPSGSRVRVGDLVDVGVEAGAEDADVDAPAGLRDVDPPLAAGRQQLDGGHRVVPDAELAREVVAAAAGEHRHHAVAAAQLARDRAGQPVAAHRGRDLAGVAGRARQLARVLDRGRAVDAEGDAVRAQRRLDVGQQLRGAAGAGGGVDDQADGAIHAAGEARRPWSRRTSTAAGRARESDRGGAFRRIPAYAPRTTARPTSAPTQPQLTFPGPARPTSRPRAWASGRPRRPARASSRR